MSFSQDILKDIGPTLAELGFHSEPKWARFPHQIIFVHPVDEDVAAYVCCRKPRDTENVVIEFWVTVLEVPDDATPPLHLGWRTIILDTYGPDGETFAGALRKLTLLLPQIPTMAETVRAELKAPCIPSRRLPIFLASRRFYLRAQSLVPAEVWTELEESALGRIKGKVSEAKFNEVKERVMNEYLGHAAREEMPESTLQTAASTFGKHVLGHALGSALSSKRKKASS